eukprot:Opistho-2@27799
MGYGGSRHQAVGPSDTKGSEANGKGLNPPGIESRTDTPSGGEGRLSIRNATNEPERGSIQDLAVRSRHLSTDQNDLISSRKSESGSSRKSSGVSLTMEQVKKESVHTPTVVPESCESANDKADAVNLNKTLFTRAFFNVDTEMSGRIKAEDLKRVFEELGVHHTHYMVDEAARTLRTADGYIGVRQFAQWADHTWGWIVNERDQPNVGTLGAVLEVDGESELDMVAVDRKREILLTMFQAADTDGSGKIMREGLLGIFKQLGWDITKGAVNNAISMLDKDNNGTIDMNEFLDWFDFAWRYKAYDKNAETHLSKNRKDAPKHVADANEVIIRENSKESVINL